MVESSLNSFAMPIDFNASILCTPLLHSFIISVLSLSCHDLLAPTHLQRPAMALARSFAIRRFSRRMY